MDALECIMSRRSIRRYTQEPVSAEQREMVLRAAMAAPSAGNQQPWHFVVITEPERLAAVESTTPYGRMLLQASFALAVCGDTRNLKHPMWEQDCSAAVENALLAAHALGLGGVWLGFWPEAQRVEPLREILGTPPGVEPFAVIAFGTPAEDKPPADRYDPALVHYERW